MVEVARASGDVVRQLAVLLLRSFVGGAAEGVEAPPLLWFQLLRERRDFLTHEDDAMSHGEKIKSA
jgi:hypothetical protein